MKKVWKAGLLIGCLFLAGCGSLKPTTEVPTITSKPKVNIVEPATPTPTITQEEGELPPASGQPESPQPEATATPTPEPVATATPKPTPKATSTPKPTAKPTSTPTPVPTKAATDSYEKGTLTENEFYSEWMGLQFVAPEGAEMIAQEELDETMCLIEESLRGEEYDGSLDYNNFFIVYEMELVWQDEGMQMSVIVEKVSDSVTVEDYAEQMQEELHLIEESGLTYTVDDNLYSEIIGDKEFFNFGYTTYYDEIGMRQENYLRKQGNRMILISITCEDYMVDNLPMLLDEFEAY